VYALGVPSIAGRVAAIRQHVLDMPAPIVATALGYHHVTTTRLAEAGTTWSNYAPGDHSKQYQMHLIEPQITLREFTRQTADALRRIRWPEHRPPLLHPITEHRLATARRDGVLDSALRVPDAGRARGATGWVRPVG
jgi:hypothetical protein